MSPLTVTQLIQLYAPLAGLLAVVFWLGVLSQKVRNLQDDVDDLKKEDGSDGDVRKLVTLEVQMGNVLTQLDSMNRSMQGVQRQLGNLMIKPTPHDFGADHG